MGLFKDSLRNWFFGTGAKAIASTSKVCLLDASGNPVGCDTIDRVSAYALSKDDFVDMGLPSGTLWAKRNVGALSETASGYYFSWGNIAGHSKGSGYDFSQAKYNTTDAASISTNLTLAQDAARANNGKAWKMPTKGKFNELLDSSYTEYIDASGNVISGTDKRTTYNGVVGLRIRSKANGNILFFPAGGYYGGTSINEDSSSGSYWSLSYYSSAAAYKFYFGSNNINAQYGFGRNYGCTIRPVI